MSTGLSPNDIRNYEFPNQMRGYDKDEVRELLEQVAVAIEKLKEENLKLSMEKDSLRSQLEGLKQMEDAIKGAAIDARRNADSLVTEAKQKVADLIAKAKTDAEEMVTSRRDEAQRLEEQITKLKMAQSSYSTKLRNAIESHLDIIADIDKIEQPSTPQVRSTAESSQPTPPPPPSQPESAPKSKSETADKPEAAPGPEPQTQPKTTGEREEERISVESAQPPGAEQEPGPVPEPQQPERSTQVDRPEPPPEQPQEAVASEPKPEPKPMAEPQPQQPAAQQQATSISEDPGAPWSFDDPGTIDTSNGLDVEESTDMTRQKRETFSSEPEPVEYEPTEEANEAGKIVPVAEQNGESDGPIDPELEAALRSYQAENAEAPELSRPKADQPEQPAPRPGEFTKTTARAEDIPPEFIAPQDDQVKNIAADAPQPDEEQDSTDKIRAQSAAEESTEHNAIDIDQPISGGTRTIPGDKPAEDNVDPDGLAKELDEVAAKFEEEMDRAAKS